MDMYENKCSSHSPGMMNILVSDLFNYCVYNFTRQDLKHQKKGQVNFHSQSELKCLLIVSKKRY